MTEAPAQPSTTVQMSKPVDGFRLAYRDRCPADWGPGDPVAVLLHGWPGDAEDYWQVVPLIDPRVRVVVPDLRGFGESDRLPVDPEFYGAQAQTRAVATLLTQLGVREAVVAGYDVGSRVAQTMAHEHPEHVAALALCPPLPGAGERVLQPHLLPELWYQFFHRIPLSVRILDGNRDAVHAYLQHFWTSWSAPQFVPDPEHLEALVDRYARPGAFEAATNWYRVGAGYAANAPRERPPAAADRIHVPTDVLWPDSDPLLPREWSDRLDEWFSDVSIRLVDGVGHFVPVEAPRDFADLVAASLARSRPQTTQRADLPAVRSHRPSQ